MRPVVPAAPPLLMEKQYPGVQLVSIPRGIYAVSMDDATGKAEYERLTAEIEAHRQEQSAAARRRTELIRQMLTTRTQAEVAGILGVTPGRIGQLSRRT